jgi:hypothetical protein
MDIEKFLTTILADEGQYCVVGIKGKTVRQEFFNSKKDLVEQALEFDEQGYDVYSALASFKDNRRVVSSVAAIQSFFMDLDCGEGKPFENKKDALQKLRAFCKKAGLQKPTIIVDSGRGVHTYWALSNPVDIAKWQPIATRLKLLCKAHSFEADAVVTADAARILRIPGTRNFKTSPPAQSLIVGDIGKKYDISEFENLNSPSKQIVVPETTKPMTPEDQKLMENLMGNYTKKFSKILIKTAEGKGCAQIDRAVKSPADLTYAQWIDVLSVVKFCEEGPVAIHEISKNYEEYSYENTNKIAKSLNFPHLCTTFESNNPAGCANCPLKGKIKSPITIGMEVKAATDEDNIVHVKVDNPMPFVIDGESDDSEDSDGLFEKPTAAPLVTLQTYVIPKYPYPYFRGANGGIFLKKKNKDGDEEDVEVYHKDLYPVKRIRDPILGSCTLIRLHTKLEGVKDFVVQSTKLLSKEEFKKELGFHGVLVINPEPLMYYFMAWTKQMEAVMKEEEALTQFGWTDKLDAFVVGARRIKVNSIEDNPPSAFTQGFFKAFEPKGTLEGWIKAAEFINRPGFEAHQYMVGLSFASPLMIFVSSIKGGIFNLYSSESGLGKSQAQFLGAAVWGDSDSLVMHGTDTTNAIWNRAEIMKNIVIYIEEVTNMLPDDASNIAYKSGEGKQRNRLSNYGQNKERYRGDSWALQIGMSSNAKLGDKIAQKKASPKGEMQRLFEVEAFKLFSDTEAVMDTREFNEAIRQNYGHACVPYIQQLLKNMMAAKNLVDTTSVRLAEAAGLTVQNRIWLAQTAVTLSALLIAKQINLINFDMDNLFRWVVGKLQENKDIVSQSDVRVEDLVTNYIAENIRGVLRIKSTSDCRISDASNADVLTSPDASPMYKWVARHEYDINRLYLIAGPFKKWCSAQQLDYNDVFRKLEEQLQGRREKVRIGRGTKFNLPAVNTIVVTWDDEIPLAPKSDELFTDV